MVKKAQEKGKKLGPSDVSVQVLSNVESAVERILEKYRGSTPTESAKAMVEAQLAANQVVQNTFLTTCLFITYFEQREQANQFIEAYRKAAEEHTKRGTDGEKLAAARIAQYTNRMGKIVRAVWGVPNNTQFVPLGADETRKRLMGKGTVHEKLEALPSTRAPGKSGSTAVEQPIQLKRLATIAAQPPSLENLGKALGAVKGKGQTATAYAKLVETKLETAIKAMPEADIGICVTALADKCMASKDENLKDFGVSLRDAWKMVHTRERKPAKAAKETAK
jgi:hypothetical protein